MKMKKFISLLLAMVMALALMVPAAASSDPGKIYLKGDQTGDDFEYSKNGWSTWSNVLFFGSADENSTNKEVSAWHLVYTDKNGIESDLQAMTLKFENGEVYNWSWADGLSTNSSGKNPGWMVVAPADWGKIIVEESYIVTTSSANVQFNISGHYKAGTPIPGEETEVSATIEIHKLIGDVAPTYESFTFQILDAEGNEIDTITTNKQTGIGSKTVTVMPGTYTIHEVMTDSQALRFTAEDVTVEITADENATYEVKFVNTPNGETSTVFQITKYLNEVGNPGDGYVFDIIAADGTIIKTITSKDGGIAATEDFWVEPGTYTIREKVPTNEEYEYEPVEDIRAVVDETGNVSYEDADGNEVMNVITNIQKGKLNVTVPEEVYQQYIKQVHENKYEVYSQGTLVSHVASVSGADLPDGITGSYLKNGMTYLTINKAKLTAAGEDGVNIGIATSDPQKGNKTSWNTPAPAPKGEADQPSYNLKIEGGKLVVTSELPNIGVRLYSAKESPKGPSDFKGNYATKGHLTGATEASFDIPKGDTFKFFLHIEDTKYETNKVIGCKLVSNEVLEQVFDCALTTTVTDAAGNVVDASKQLSAGEYTVTITNDKTADTWTKTVTVNPGETTEVDFGKLTVSEMGAPVIECPQNCGQLKMVPLTPAAPVEP